MIYDNGKGLIWSDDIREENVVRIPEDELDYEEEDKYGFYGVIETSEMTKGLKEDESLFITYSASNNYISYALVDHGVKALPILLGDFIPLFKTERELSPEEIAERAINIVDGKDNNKGDEEWFLVQNFMF